MCREQFLSIRLNKNKSMDNMVTVQAVFLAIQASNVFQQNRIKNYSGQSRLFGEEIEHIAAYSGNVESYSGPRLGSRFGLSFGPRFGPRFGPKLGQRFSPRFGPSFGPKFAPKFCQEVCQEVMCKFHALHRITLEVRGCSTAFTETFASNLKTDSVEVCMSNRKRN